VLIFRKLDSESGSMAFVSDICSGLPALAANKENEQGKALRSGKMTLDRRALGIIENRGSFRRASTRRTLKAKRVNAEPPREAKVVQDLPVLPPGVRNIDGAESDPQLCKEYAPFLYGYLRELERQLPIRKEFLKNCHVNGKMRAVLIDWLVEVHNQFKLLQETLYMTIYIIDRYMTLDGMSIKRSKFQLLGVAAMFTASKVEEMYAPEINDFVYITDNAFSAAEIRQMELKILETINFALQRPIALHFLRRNSRAGDVDIQQHTLAKYFIELSQVEYDMAHIPPSLLAACSLYLALMVLGHDGDSDMESVWNRSLEYYSTYTYLQMLPTVCKLANIIKKAADGKLKAVYTKYCTKKMMKVAELEELKGEMINMLASKHLNSFK